MMTTVVAVGCKEPRACKWLTVFRAKADVIMAFSTESRSGWAGERRVKQAGIEG
jgi:hypothetical protein